MKRTALLRAFLLALPAIFLPLSSPAAEGEVVTVTATGYGETVAEAKKDAGRNAVLTVAGQLLDAKTLVENEEILTDRILTYSGAYLEDLQIVGKPVRRKSTGLVEVTVNASVRKAQLGKKLADENVGTKAKLKKGKLFAQATSRAQEAQDASTMLSAAFEGFPGNVLRFEVCKNADGTPAVSVDSAEGTVSVDVSLGIDPTAWKTLAQNLVAKLERMASSGEDTTWKLSWNGSDGGSPYLLHDGYVSLWNGAGSLQSRWKALDDSPGFRLAVVSALRPGASVCRAHEFVFSDNNAKAVCNAVWKKMAREMRLTVSLTADGELLEEKTVKFRATPGGALFAKWGGSGLTENNASICLLPAICDGGHFAPTGRFTIGFGRVAPETIRDATDVETSVRFFVLDDRGYDWVPLSP